MNSQVPADPAAVAERVTVPANGDHGAETLRRCQRMVQPALRAAVAELHPLLRRMASYTFGWCDARGVQRDGDGGKGLRPALTVLAAESVGARGEAAVAAAVSVELVHAFSIVHDDIMDGDERRRHRASVWKAFGEGPAVLAGDALLALALETVTRGPHTGGMAAVGHLATTLVELVDGQAADIAFERRPWSGPHAVTVEEYTAMAARKTGALFGCATALGAALARAPDPLVRAMREMGGHLGMAFQATDDLLGIWGDPRVTGKPVFSDLSRRKKTLPVVSALGRGTEPARRLAGLLAGRPGQDPAALRAAAALIDEAGGRAYTRALADRHLGRARAILDDVGTDRAATAELAALSTSFVDRAR